MISVLSCNVSTQGYPFKICRKSSNVCKSRVSEISRMTGHIHWSSSEVKIVVRPMTKVHRRSWWQFSDICCLADMASLIARFNRGTLGKRPLSPVRNAAMKAQSPRNSMFDLLSANGRLQNGHMLTSFCPMKTTVVPKMLPLIESLCPAALLIRCERLKIMDIVFFISVEHWANAPVS